MKLTQKKCRIKLPRMKSANALFDGTGGDVSVYTERNEEEGRI